MADKVVSTKVRYDVEEATIRNVVDSTERVRKAIEKVDDPLGDLGIAAEGGVRRMRAEFGSASRDIELVHDDVRVLINDLEHLDRIEATPTITLPNTAARNVIGRNTGRLETVDRAGSSASQILSGLGLDSNAVGLVGDIAGAFESLTPAGLAVVGMGTVMSIAFEDLKRRGEEARKKIEDITAAILDFNRQAAAGATSHDIREQIELAQRERDGLKQTRAEIADILSNFSPLGLRPEVSDDQLTDLNRRISDATFGQITDLVSGSIAAGDAGFLQANGVLQGLNTRFNELNTTIVQGMGALDSGITAQNDAAAAADQLTERFVNLVTGGVDVVKGAISELHTQYEEQAQLLQTLTDKEKQLVLAEEARAQAAQVLAQAAVTTATDQLFSARTDLVAKTNALAEAETALAKSEGDHIEKIVSITADATDKRAHAVAKANDAEEQAQVEHVENVAEINRRAFLSERDAVRTRNVVAAIRANEAKDEELRKEAITADKRLDVIEDSLDDQLDSIAANARRSIQTVQKQGRDEQQIKAIAVQRARVDLTNAENGRLALERQFRILSANADLQHYGVLQSIHNTGMGRVLDTVISRYNSAIAVLAAGKYNPGVTVIPHQASGGAFGFTGGGGGGMVFNITGQTRQQALRQIDTRLRAVMED